MNLSINTIILSRNRAFSYTDVFALLVFNCFLENFFSLIACSGHYSFIVREIDDIEDDVSSPRIGCPNKRIRVQPVHSAKCIHTTVGLFFSIASAIRGAANTAATDVRLGR